jgi:hypothetical protein
MDDFSALAQRVALGVGDVPGCLILSREGLVLGSYPDHDNGRIKQAWLRFATLGSAERGFVELSDQVWVYAHRGPYAAFAVAEVSVRPGLLLDMLEQALLEAEDSRTRRESLRSPEATASPAPSGGPRTAMHAAADRPQLVPDPVAPDASLLEESILADVAEEAASDPAPAASADLPRAADEPVPEPEPEPPPEPNRPSAKKGKQPVDDDAEVDRVMLAQEFSGLLQATDNDDEG